MGTGNILLMSDSYKTSHYRLYPEKCETVYSYFEARARRMVDITFFGLQYLIKRYLEGVVVTEDKIKEAKLLIDAHMGKGMFYEEGWRYILKEHGGKLPIKICAVKEGSVHTPSKPLITVENTDPECFWLTNYLETLLVQVWYPCTVATQSRMIRKVIMEYLRKTGTPKDIELKLHCFGFRGVSSTESAGIGSMAHLVNFKGSDTMVANVYAKKYYHEDMASFSIPASEHSTITSWGRENEAKAFKNMLVQYKDSPLVACVSDSYDIENACQNIWGDELYDDVVDFKGMLVVRPDSGDPTITVKECVRDLDDAFGHEINDKGYRVLNNVRVLQGDGVDFDSIKKILFVLESDGYSADNIAFGMGGSLLQRLDRDIHAFAYKCSEVTIDGEARAVFKSPIGDESKRSKSGRFTEDLYPVFENGELLADITLEEVRKNTLAYLK